METKLYFIEEHKETIFDPEQIEKWNEIVEILGLEKQKALKAEGKSPIPFPVLTKLESTIYNDVLESKQCYKTFDMEAIPLEVLSMISLCEKEKYFDTIEIWYSRNNPDPMVIGQKYPDENSRKNGYTWYQIPYKIAAWGAKLKPASDLLQAWDEMKRFMFKEKYDTELRQHENLLNQLKFLGAAFESDTTTLPF